MGRRTAALALVAVAGLSGCGSAAGGGRGGARNRDGGAAVTVVAASSLQPAFRRLAQEAPGLRVTLSFAGSNRIASQVRNGLPADVVATADEETLVGLRRAGLLATAPEIFATNRLAIAVRPGNPEGIRSLKDLGRPSLDVVLAASSVPAGRYAARMLSAAGLRVQPISLEDSVAAVAARVERREADAGLVYATDGRRRNGRPGVETVAIPPDQNVTARYPMAVLDRTGRRAAADRFVRFVTSAEGRRILAGAGFGPP